MYMRTGKAAYLLELDESWFPRHQEIREALLDRLGVNVLIGYKKE